MEVLRLMSRKGDETFKFDPTDPKDVTRIKSKVKEWLEKGYYFYGALKGDKKMKLLTKTSDLEDGQFDRFIMSPGSKKLLSPPPMGG